MSTETKVPAGPGEAVARGTAHIAGRESAPPRPFWHQVLVRPEMMTAVLLVLGVIIASQISPYFLDISYILRSFTLSAEFAIVALVLTMVIIAGEIDLSPAANMALSACLFAYAQSVGVPMPVAIGIGLVAGLVMGALNAFMVIALQLPSIIVTIGTLTLYRGLAQVIAGDKSIRVPEWFIGLDRVLVLGMPVPVLIFIVAALVLGLVLAGTIFGRQIYQIGTNEVAARHAGIRSRRIKTVLFLMIGLVSAIAGMMTASRLGSVRYDLGLGGELQMVLMAMLGGTYIFGGRGTILGTFLAAWLLVVVSTGMTVANWLPAIQLTVLGILLIIAIIATNFIYSRTQR
ncbi:MAG: ABC transporter permease [Devosia sp.]